MRLDRHSVRTLMLVTWSVFLFWMWGAGETARYLGPRTQWLVPFGAIALAVAAWAYSRAPASAEGRAPLSRSDALGLLALLLPLVAGLLLANSQLGALAASKKLTARGLDPSALAELASRNSSTLDFVQVKVAEHNKGFADSRGIHPGRDVRLVGFVLHSPKAGARAPFELARFYITCCVADSVPIGVTIDPADPRAPTIKRDGWLSVSGELVRAGRSLRLRATEIRPAKAPRNPYRSFSN